MESQTLKAVVFQDDELLAGAIADALAAMGFDVRICGFTVSEAVAFAKTHHWDLSIVDATLHGFDAGLVIDKLRARRTPFIITVGEPAEMGEAYASEVMLRKPFSLADLREAVIRAWKLGHRSEDALLVFSDHRLSRVS